MCHRDVDEPLEYLVERHVAGIKTHLNEQFFDRKILRHAFESAMQYGSQIWRVLSQFPLRQISRPWREIWLLAPPLHDILAPTGVITRHPALRTFNT
jgi:hypothetical protein